MSPAGIMVEPGERLVAGRPARPRLAEEDVEDCQGEERQAGDVGCGGRTCQAPAHETDRKKPTTVRTGAAARQMFSQASAAHAAATRRCSRRGPASSRPGMCW